MGVSYDEQDPFETQTAGPSELGNAITQVGAELVKSQAQHEIQSAIVVAKNYKRNEAQIYQKFVFGSCNRLGFALVSEYSYKKGMKKDDSGKWVPNIVTGPTVKFARELARLWGNIRYGAVPIADAEDQRQILAYAWDLEANTWIQQGDLFEKLVEKKDGWIEPDERELRELSNRRASIGIRNCLAQIMPPDFIEDGLAQCKETIKAAMKDPEKVKDVKKRIIQGFSQINVDVAELEIYLGHPLDKCDPNELETLRGIYVSIKEGHTSWHGYKKAAAESTAPGLPINIERKSGAAPTAQPVQNGHSKTPPAGVHQPRTNGRMFE